MIRTSFGKRIAKLTVCIILIEGLIHWLNFSFCDLYVDRWGRILWHNYYAETDNIDNLFLGSSVVYHGINPFLLDELNGENNFNLASNSQRLNGTYYLLREANGDHHLSHVYLDLNYWVSTGLNADFKQRDNLAPNWKNTDFMKLSINKIEYMLTMCEIENYPETFLPFLRYRSKLFDTEYVKEQLDNKREEEYKQYKYSEMTDSNDAIEYRDKGFCYVEEELEQKDLLIYREDRILDENAFTKDAEHYLRKIIEYCQNENIELTLFSAPMYELQLISAGDYDIYVKQIRQIAAEYGLAYYDFNLCRKEYFPIQEIENFRDCVHLNGKGGEMFTNFFWKVMEEESADYFYDTYAEKLENSKETVYGLVYTDGNDMVNYRIASNRESGMEYRVVTLPEDQIQDFSGNKDFTLKAGVHGTLRLEARKTGEDEIISSLEIVY